MSKISLFGGALVPPAPLPNPTNKKIFKGKPCYIEGKKINVFH